MPEHLRRQLPKIGAVKCLSLAEGKKASACEGRLLKFWGAYSGMLVSGVAYTWGSGAAGSSTCTG